jgi:hypothetical protein
VAPGTATGRLPARPGANATPARRWLDEQDKNVTFIERLRPSETIYVSWTEDRRRLRFSKSGDPNLERAYRTHWLPPKR